MGGDHRKQRAGSANHGRRKPLFRARRRSEHISLTTKGTSRPAIPCPVQALPPDIRTVISDLKEAAEIERCHLAGRPQPAQLGRRVPIRFVANGRLRSADLRLFDDQKITGNDRIKSSLSTQLKRWHGRGSGSGTVTVLARGDSPFPWCCSSPAESRLADYDRIPVGRALDDGLRLVRIVASLHENGMIHGGVEPRTVVFDPKGRPCLDAVGIADVLRRHMGVRNVLDPSFATPEHFEVDQGIVDRTTDVYQCGAVLFRMLTGLSPYAGSTADIRDGVLSESPVPRPSTVHPSIPTALDRVVRRATEPDSFDRYESASELASALERVSN